jgi:hypothetical protein
VPEAGGDGDDEAHVRLGHPVERRFVPLLAPEDGQGPLLVPFEEGGVHRGANEATTDS